MKKHKLNNCLISFTLFLLVACSVETTTSQSKQQDTAAFNNGKRVEENANQTLALNDSFKFSNEVSLVKIINYDSLLELVNLRNGCLISFNVLKRGIINDCLLSLYIDDFYSLKAYKNDSLYFLSNEDIDNYKTVISDGDSNTLTLDGFLVEDITNRKALLTTVEYIHPSPNIYVLDLNNGSIDSLGIRGTPMFLNDKMDSIFYSSFLPDGSVEFHIYDATTKGSTLLFQSEKNLLPFSVDFEKKTVLCTTSGKSNVYEVDLVAKEYNLIIEDSEVYTPIHFKDLEMICYINGSKQLVEFREYKSLR